MRQSESLFKINRDMIEFPVLKILFSGSELNLISLGIKQKGRINGLF